MAEQCQAKARSGEPCSARVVDGRHCAWHSTAPEWIEKRREWSAEGGRKRSNKSRAAKALPAEPMTPEELQAYLSLAFKSVLTGKLAPNIGNALSALARSMVQVRDATMLEERIDKLEALQAEHDRRLA